MQISMAPRRPPDPPWTRPYMCTPYTGSVGTACRGVRHTSARGRVARVHTRIIPQDVGRVGRRTIVFHRVRTPTAKASHRPTDRPKDRLYANSIATTHPSFPDVFLHVPWNRVSAAGAVVGTPTEFR